MRNESLTFSHPIDHLKIYELDTAKWDFQNPPEIFHTENSAVVPYMPPIPFIDVQKKGRIEPLENGQSRFFFELSHAVPELWQLFFENYRNGVNVTFDGNMLILCCDPKELQKSYNAICNSAIHAATRDYVNERDTLLWRVLPRMMEQERRAQTEVEALAELEGYKEKRQIRIDFAQENRLSVSFLVQNFNDRYREILENKFSWWGRILDSQTVCKLRAMFELELLAV